MNTQIETVRAKNGQPTLRACMDNGRKIYLHSAYDPEREADTWARNAEFGPNDVILLFGCGVGYAPEALRQRLSPANHLLILDPLAGAPSRHLARTLEDPRIQLARSIDELRTKYDQIENACWKGLRLLRLPSWGKLFPEPLKELANWASAQANTLKIHRNTVFKTAQLWQKNLFENIPRLFQSGAASSSFGMLEGKPAIIVSAGPSLAKNMHLLEEAKDRALIIATGTAARLLALEGLPYHLVISVDPHAVNWDAHFEGISHGDALLLYDVTTTPKVVASHKGPRAAFYSLPDCQWLDDFFNPGFGLLKTGGSVANIAFDLAVKLGADPIVLIGQDLGYTGGQLNATGTYQDPGSHLVPADWFEKDEEEIRTLLEEHPGFAHLYRKGRLRVPGIDGQPIWTDHTLYGFLCWFEQEISEADEQPVVFDSTEGGALIHGTRVADLTTVLSEHCRVDISSSLHKLRARLATPVKLQRASLESYLSDQRKKVSRLRQSCEQMLEMIGEGRSTEDILERDQEVTERLDQLKTFLHFALVPALVQRSNLSLESLKGKERKMFLVDWYRTNLEVLDGSLGHLTELLPGLQVPAETGDQAKRSFG